MFNSINWKRTSKHTKERKMMQIIKIGAENNEIQKVNTNLKLIFGKTDNVFGKTNQEKQKI